MIKILEYIPQDSGACRITYEKFPIGLPRLYIFPRQIDALNYINRNLESIIFGELVPENIKNLFSEPEN